MRFHIENKKNPTSQYSFENNSTVKNPTRYDKHTISYVINTVFS